MKEIVWNSLEKKHYAAGITYGETVILILLESTGFDE